MEKLLPLAIEDGQLIGVILSGHDDRRGIVHHLCIALNDKIPAGE